MDEIVIILVGALVLALFMLATQAGTALSEAYDRRRRH